MPLLSDKQHARDLILNALEGVTRLDALKVRGLVQRADDLDDLHEIRVDDLGAPSAILVRSRTFSSMTAPDPASAGRLLAELDWRAGRNFAGAHEDWLPLIEAHAPIEWQSPCWLYHMPRSVSLSLIEDLLGPPEARISTPEPGDAERLLTHWPYGEVDDSEDVAYILSRIARGPAVGWREPGVGLVSWAMVGDDGSMGFMHTLRDWRGRGIAMKVSAALALKVRATGQVPYAFVIEENTAPLAMTKKLGFVRSDARYVWLGTGPGREDGQ